MLLLQRIFFLFLLIDVLFVSLEYAFNYICIIIQQYSLHHCLKNKCNKFKFKIVLS